VTALVAITFAHYSRCEHYTDGVKQSLQGPLMGAGDPHLPALQSGALTPSHADR
jgi:hypothetical protein